MAEITGTRQPLLSALAAMNRDLVRMMTDAAERAVAAVVSLTDADGKIPEERLAEAQERIGVVIEGIFFIPGTKRVFGEGNVGLTPFARALNQRMVEAMWGAIDAHRRHMTKRLPYDVLTALRTNSQRFERAVVVAEQSDEDRRRFLEKYGNLRIFDPAALANYVPPHEWVDPAGRVLSARIWRTGRQLSLKVDDLVAESIRRGDPVSVMGQLLLRFLRPDTTDFPDNKPYGKDGSFAADRLAQAEITLAHSRTALAAARMNPYADVMYFRLSESHAKPDKCDPIAAASPYSLTGYVPLPVQDTHLFCLCLVAPGTSRAPSVVTTEIREALNEGYVIVIRPYVTPIVPLEFLTQLIGALLALLAPAELRSAV